MLRISVLVLLLANAAYFAWTSGLLAILGLVPTRQDEPERLARQIRPEAVVLTPIAQPLASKPVAAASQPVQAEAQPSLLSILSPSPAPAPAASATALAAGLQCLKVGVFTEQQAAALRYRLQAALPAGSWNFDSNDGAVRWIVYMGRYISKDALGRKRAKLEQLGVAYETPVSPRLNPGLSLGGFGSKAEAEAAMEQLGERGIRTAKVVLERPELPSLWLTVPAADAALQTKLEALKPQFGGKAVQPCR